MVSLASVHHWLFMKAMTSSMVCIELKTKCHRQHDLNIYHISILDSGSRPAAASLRFMPSDAKSWKTRTDIIKCRYLHRVLPSSSSSSITQHSIYKNLCVTTWFEYSTFRQWKKNSSTGKRWKVDIRNVGNGSWGREHTTPCLLVALILIPHGAAFLDEFFHEKRH